MVFNVISETLNSLITQAGTFVQEFIDSFWNVIDNDYMSMDKNIGRFTDAHLSQNVSSDIPIGADVLVFIPLALVLGAINLGLNVWYSYLNRDAWDAYWEKEAHKLDRIQQLLDKKASSNPSPASNVDEEQSILLNNIIEEEPAAADLYPRRIALLEKIAQRLTGYQEDTEIFNSKIIAYKEKHREKIDEIAPLEKALTKLTTTLEQCKLNNPTVWEQARLPVQKKQINDYLAMLVPAVNTEGEGLGQAAEETSLLEQSAKLTLWQEVKNKLLGFVENFSDNSIFYSVFSYAWGYWFVFFFTVWGLPEYSLFTTVPIEFSLFALICPVIYLIYKEYIAYKTSLNIDLSETEKESFTETLEKESSPATNEFKRSFKLKILDERAANNVQFRWGWVLVALIAGLSVGAICGLSIVGAVFVGITVFIGVLLVVKGVTDFTDKEAHKKREELLKREELENEELENELMPEPENPLLLDRSTRKKWAQSRKHVLKEIEYLLECLKQNEQVEEIARAMNLKIEPSPKVTVEENDENKFNNRIIKAKSCIDELRNEQLHRAKIYQCIGTGLDFLSTYMSVAAMIGFVGLDFLGNIFHVVLIASSAPLTVPVIICTVLVGLIALLAGSSSAYRTWNKHKEQDKVFATQLNQPDYQNKQIKLLEDTERVKNLRETLKNQLQQNKRLFQPDHFGTLHQLLNKPVKESSWTLRKSVKMLRRITYVITSVSSVMLITRAVLTMGLLALIPALAGGSLVVFAAVSNPLGIAVLSIAAVLLLFRVARELYLSVKHARAVQKAEHINSKLEKRENELEHLEQVRQLFEKVIGAQHRAQTVEESPPLLFDGQRQNNQLVKSTLLLGESSTDLIISPSFSLN